MSNKGLREMVYFAMNNYLEGLNCFTIQLDDVIEIAEKVKKKADQIYKEAVEIVHTAPVHLSPRLPVNVSLPKSLQSEAKL